MILADVFATVEDLGKPRASGDDPEPTAPEDTAPPGKPRASGDDPMSSIAYDRIVE